jgi:hypothetical protein
VGRFLTATEFAGGRPQGGGYSAFGAKEGGEDVTRNNAASPRFN